MAIPMASFTKLNREACRASIMIEGLTGKGKSGLALMIAYGLTGGFKELPEGADKSTNATWEKIFTIDTENRSLNLFIGIPTSWGETFGQFYGAQLTSEDGYAPSNYLYLRDAAVKAGADVVISDSVTHMWTAKGGVLDKVNEIKLKNPRMDNYRVWGEPEVSAEKQALIDVIRDHRCHVITTVRVKEKFDMQYNADKQKNEVVSIGEQQLQQEGLKYEPDLVLHMENPGSGNPQRNPRAKVIKSRYAILAEGETYEFTPALCEQLRQYLAEGVSIETLLEQQRQDYVRAVKEILDTNTSAKTIWPVLKDEAKVKDKKLDDIELPILKHLYSQLIAD
jgi:hypothetical protein